MSEKLQITTTPETTAQEALRQPAAEERASALRPEDAFAAHVRLVATEGDGFDARQSNYGMKHWSVMTATYAGCFGAMAAMELSPLTIAGASATAATLAGLQVARSIRAQKNELPGRLGVETQELLGENYELFRMRLSNEIDPAKTSVVMRYGGPKGKEGRSNMPADEVVGHVHKMASLAAENGIANMTVEAQLFTQLFGLHSVRVGNTAALLQKRGIAASGELEKDMFVAGVPQYWQELSAQRRLQSVNNDDEIGALVETLRSVSPEHPMVRTYDTVAPAKDAELLRKGLIAAGRRQAERDFSRSESSKFAGFQNRADPDSFEVVTTRQSWVADAIDGGNTVAWNHQGLTVGSASVWKTLGVEGAAFDAERDTDDTDLTAKLEAMRANPTLDPDGTALVAILTAKNIKQLVLHPERDPKLAAQLLPLLISQKMQLSADDRERFRTLPKRIKLEGREEEQGRVLPLYTSPMLQELNTLPGSMRNHRLNQAMAAGIAAVLVGGVVWGGTYEAGQKYDEALATARNQIAATRHVDPNTIGLRDPLVKGLVASESMEGRAWGYIDDATQWAHRLGSNSAPAAIIQSNSSATSASETASAGNVDPNTPIQTDWTLKPIGGADPGGYWESATSYTLYGEPAPGGLQWRNSTDGIGRQKLEQLPLPQGFYVRQGIKVDRQVQQGDVSSAIPGSEDIRIPVQVGMRPVAASLDGKPLRLVQLYDNRFMLQSDGTITGGNLEYVIVPSPKGAFAREPRTEGMISFNGKSIGYGEWAMIQGAFQKYIPGYAGTLSQKERVALVGQYIDQNFDYRLQPLNGVLPGEGAAEFAGFAEEVLRAKDANCNVASTLVALAAVDDRATPGDTTIGVATGYLNKDDGANTNTLTSNESHQWNDADGNIIDHTPSKGISPADAAYLGGTQKAEAAAPVPPPKSLVPLELGLVAAAGLGLAYVRRRELKYMYRNKQAQRLQHKERTTLETQERAQEQRRRTMNAIPAEDLWTAAEVLNAVLYDPAAIQGGRLQAAHERGRQQAATMQHNGSTAANRSALATLTFLHTNTLDDQGRLASGRIGQFLVDWKVAKDDKMLVRQALRTLRTVAKNSDTTDFTNYLQAAEEPIY